MCGCRAVLMTVSQVLLTSCSCNLSPGPDSPLHGLITTSRVALKMRRGKRFRVVLVEIGDGGAQYRHSLWVNFVHSSITQWAKFKGSLASQPHMPTVQEPNSHIRLVLLSTNFLGQSLWMSQNVMHADCARTSVLWGFDQTLSFPPPQ